MLYQLSQIININETPVYLNLRLHGRKLGEKN